MNIHTAEKLLNELKEQINYHNKKYYEDDSPEISDYEYDMMLLQLESLEAQFPQLLTEVPRLKR